MLDKIVGNEPNIAWIKNRTIFLTRAGSHSYGTNTPESDEDFRGVCIPPREYLHGFTNRFEQIVRDDPDAQIFGIQKFFALAFENNPNIIEMLFTDEADHLLVTPAGKEMLAHRDEFISQACKARFLGYARQQAYKIKLHRRWLFEGVKEPPKRSDYGLPEKPEIKKQDKEVIFALVQKKIDSWNLGYEPFSESQKIYLNDKVADILSEMKLTADPKWEAAARTLGLGENFIALLIAEKSFASRENDFREYQKWLKNRNPIRAALELKYGYDTKHGGHLVRLLRMGLEILRDHMVIVKRPDAAELLEIRNGKVPFDDLIAYAKKMEELIEEISLTSTLRAMPNAAKLNVLCMKLIEKSFQ